jgi:hypothetical protein
MEIQPLNNLNGIMNTYTGQLFSIFDPKPEQIDILDIAQGLAFKCHFAGQTPQFFSVAQHSILVAELLEQSKAETEIILLGLLHDAPEAYINDMISPIKIKLPLFQWTENMIMYAIAIKFKMNLKYMHLVKVADKKAQEIEFDVFYKNIGSFNYLSPEDSKSQFLTRFYKLQNGK